MDGCSIENCTMPLVVEKGSLELTSSVLRSNRARRGGAVQIINGQLKAYGTLFEGNTATESGGALDIDVGSAHLANGSL